MELTRGCLANCLGKLVNNPEANCDVTITFKNSNVKYYAHKLILSARSNVFQTMFYGAVKEVTTTCNKFEIADVEPEIFLELLTFMYTDQINLNEDTFSHIVYASHKYNIEYLDSRCADFLIDRLDHNNVCCYLNQCYMYDNAVTEECLMFIDLTIEDLIMLRKLNQLCDDALNMVVERDTLRVKEIDLFKYLVNRTSSEMSSTTNEPMTKRKKTISTIFEQVRFPTMSVDEFSECFKLKPEIFRTEQISSIFKFCSTAVRDDNLLYSTEKRAYDTKFNDDEINVIEFVGTRVSTQKDQKLEFYVFRPLALCQIEVTTMFADITLSKLDENGKSVTLSKRKSRVGSTGRNAVLSFHPHIILLPEIKYVLATHSDCGGKLICERVAPNDKFGKLFNFTFFRTTVKKISFKQAIRKRLLENEQ